ncbi:MAG: MBL fold metallo-hydrolase [Evtepia sp.]
MQLKDADCTVVQSEGKVMVIDTGAPEDAQTVMLALERLGIERIHCLLLTHPDRDHIGNASAILQQYPVEQIRMPNVKKNSEIESVLLCEIAAQNIAINHPEKTGETFAFGACSMRMFPGYETAYEQINDHSIAAVLTCGTVRVFFGGDIENKRIKEFLHDPIAPCDVVKMPHHGRDEKKSAALLSMLRPKICVVTADHAEEAVEAALSASRVCYTAEAAVYITIHDNKLELERGTNE